MAQLEGFNASTSAAAAAASSGRVVAGGLGRKVSKHDLPLIPGDMNSLEDSLENFIRIFQSRYGEVHPSFRFVAGYGFVRIDDLMEYKWVA